MKTVVKHWSGNVDLYRESYDNYMEFYETLMNRQANAKKTLERVLDDGGKSWVGIGSVEEAKKLFLTGWEKPLEKLKLKVENEIKAIGLRERRKPFVNVCGYSPIIPNALMRLPKAMMDSKPEKVKSKVLKFLVIVNIPCGIDCDEVIDKMSKKLAYIASLERSGKYRCRIEVDWSGFGGLGQNGNKYSACCSVLVKSEDQPFDVKRLCYPIINPSMARLLMFSWYESLPLDERDYYIDGYGRSFPRWDINSKEAYKKAVTENNESVICVDLDTDIENMLKKGGVIQ